MVDVYEQAAFWTCIVMLAYTYAGYPLLIWMLASRRDDQSQGGTRNFSVSVVVVAFNEEQRIAKRIENLLALEPAGDPFEIIIASDGSTDATADVAMRYLDAGIKVIEFGSRRGKPAVLNDILPELTSDIIVLLDVRQRIERGALKALIADFADPRIGAVSGELILEQGDSEVGEGVGFYWRYEKFIRVSESVAGSTVGATGAIYAIRRELFQPIPTETILDDVLIPMKIASRGYRVLFEPRAHAYDRVAETSNIEYARKVRTIAGNFQLLFRERWLLNPFANRLWFQTVSHKFLRLLGPICLCAAFALNVSLLSLPLFQVVFVLQFAFYCAAIAGWLLKYRSSGMRALNVAYSFCLLNWATLVGLMEYLTGVQRVTWNKH